MKKFCVCPSFYFHSHQTAKKSWLFSIICFDQGKQMLMSHVLNVNKNDDFSLWFLKNFKINLEIFYTTHDRLGALGKHWELVLLEAVWWPGFLPSWEMTGQWDELPGGGSWFRASGALLHAAIVFFLYLSTVENVPHKRQCWTRQGCVLSQQTESTTVP